MFNAYCYSRKFIQFSVTCLHAPHLLAHCPPLQIHKITPSLSPFSCIIFLSRTIILLLYHLVHTQFRSPLPPLSFTFAKLLKINAISLGEIFPAIYIRSDTSDYQNNIFLMLHLYSSYFFLSFFPLSWHSLLTTPISCPSHHWNLINYGKQRTNTMSESLGFEDFLHMEMWSVISLDHSPASWMNASPFNTPSLQPQIGWQLPKKTASIFILFSPLKTWHSHFRERLVLFLLLCLCLLWSYCSMFKYITYKVTQCWPD